MGLKIIWGDITKEPTEVIVTLASSEPRVGSGVDKAVHKAAGGDRLLNARLAKMKKMGPGLAVFTNSYGLAKTCGAKEVLHISSIPWEGGEQGEEILLSAGYFKACALVALRKSNVVTIPVMGAGVYNMPKARALNCAVKALYECSQYFPNLQIKLVTNEKQIFDYASRKYKPLCEAHYTAEAEAAYNKKFPPPKRGLKKDFGKSLIVCDDELDFWKGVKIRQLSKEGTFASVFRKLWDIRNKHDRNMLAQIKKSCVGKTTRARKADLERRLAERDSLLLSLRVLQDDSGVSLSTIKHILYDHVKCESRDSVLALGIALSLTKATLDLLLRKWGSKLGEDLVDAEVVRFIRQGGCAADELNSVLKKKGIRELTLEVHTPQTVVLCKAKKRKCCP